MRKCTHTLLPTGLCASERGKFVEPKKPTSPSYCTSLQAPLRGGALSDMRSPFGCMSVVLNRGQGTTSGGAAHTTANRNGNPPSNSPSQSRWTLTQSANADHRLQDWHHCGDHRGRRPRGVRRACGLSGCEFGCTDDLFRLATRVRHVRRIGRNRILLSRTWPRLVPTEFSDVPRYC